MQLLSGRVPNRSDLRFPLRFMSRLCEWDTVRNGDVTFVQEIHFYQYECKLVPPVPKNLIVLPFVQSATIVRLFSKLLNTGVFKRKDKPKPDDKVTTVASICLVATLNKNICAVSFAFAIEPKTQVDLQ